MPGRGGSGSTVKDLRATSVLEAVSNRTCRSLEHAALRIVPWTHDSALQSTVMVMGQYDLWSTVDGTI